MATPERCTLTLPPIALDEHHHSHQNAYSITPIILTLAVFQRELPNICQRLFQTIGSQQSEATYQRCLKLDLLDAGVEKVHLEVEIPLTYKGVVVSCRRSDMIVELACGGRALLEFKAVPNEMTIEHRRQIEYYLHHADINDGYLINFPHDAGFADVTDKSKFEYSGLAGITQQLSSLQLGGPVLRLRNHPSNREVEVVHIRRKIMGAEEQNAARITMASAPPPIRLGITKSGTICKICKKQNRLCRLHIHQAT
ncbi:unnamed protein product [Cylindrotheca closterium]|uniref:GxxExxY protein n=1 Tax=Cylindrotheca closterium TaxID=2856 RepID=A0AAD2CG23_9STRA|nr:unnamed protein product [Cylindrotheca closterium]